MPGSVCSTCCHYHSTRRGSANPSQSLVLNMFGKRSLLQTGRRAEPDQYKPLAQGLPSDINAADPAASNGDDTSLSTGASSLHASETTGAPRQDASHPPNPLPYPIIFALCMGRFAEGLMFGVILPYINEMVHGMGVKEADLGKWSAAAVSQPSPRRPWR